MDSSQQIPLILPPDCWPVADRDAWNAILAPPDDWGGGGGPGHYWSAGTIKLRHQAYAQWLSFLMRKCPALLEVEPCLRITRETVGSYFEEGEQRLQSRSIATLLSGLAETAIAMFPDEDWKWLRNASASFLRLSTMESTEPLPDLTATDIFDQALARLACLHDAYDPSGPVAQRRRHAVEQRQALMLAFLVSCPVRHRALLAMTLSWHLLKCGGGLRVRFRAEDMKTGRAAEMPLPAVLGDHFNDYVDLHRPILLGKKTSDALWISQRGNPIESNSLSKIFANHVERHLGARFSPHKLRHIAATTIAETAPEKSAIIAGILGHTTMRTAENHYIRATARRASLDLAALVDAGRAGRKPRGKGKKPQGAN